MASRPAAADIVNVQTVLSASADEGMSGSITGAMDLRKGNTSKLLFSVAPVARYRAGEHLFIAYGSGEYDDNSDIGKVFGHGRYRFRVHPRITAEVFAQGEYDQRRALELRALAGVGPLFHLFERDDLKLAWGVAYMLEHESYKPEVVVDDGLQHRVSTYLTGSISLADNLQLAETVYFQPRLDAPRSVRFLNDSALIVTISSYLSFNTSFGLAYDGRFETDPADPAAIKGYDLTLKSSITVQF